MKKNLYYQTDITDEGCTAPGGGSYCHAHVLVFEAVDIENCVCSVEPLLEVKIQSHPRKRDDESGLPSCFVPVHVRHNNMTDAGAYVPWYSADYMHRARGLWGADKSFHRASLVMARIDKTVRVMLNESPESVERDELKVLISALRRLKARPVKYGSGGKYEVQA
ncbi:MAG: hypothetical protein ACYSWO_28690 [Planctomycetota bacterium]